jgi:hypothetical protein
VPKARCDASESKQPLGGVCIQSDEERITMPRPQYDQNADVCGIVPV